MSTVTNTSTKTSSTAPSSTGSTSFLTKASITQAGFAANFIYQMENMFSKIIDLQQKQNQSMTEVTAKAGKAESDETRASGEAYGNALIASGTLTAVGGLASVGMAYHEGDTLSAAKTKQRDVETEGTQINKVADMDKQVALEHVEVRGGDVEPNRYVAPRRQELMGRNYDAQEPGMTREQNNDLTRNAIRDMHADPEGADLAQFRESYNRDLDRNSQQLNAATTNVQTIHQKKQTYGQFVNTLGQSASSVAQGLGNMKKAAHDAEATLYRTNGSLAGSQTQAMTQAASKAYDSQNQAIDVLAGVRRSSSPN